MDSDPQSAICVPLSLRQVVEDANSLFLSHTHFDQDSDRLEPGKQMGFVKARQAIQRLESTLARFSSKQPRASHVVYDSFLLLRLLPLACSLPFVLRHANDRLAFPDPIVVLSPRRWRSVPPSGQGFLPPQVVSPLQHQR